MQASRTLPQHPISGKLSIIKNGVLTLHGFGVRVRIRFGHLEIEDGVGMDRRKIRLARVGHKLKRLVCISENGFATLSALKWLSDVGASFVMLNRNGKILVATGPTTNSDARLRRAQALALGNGIGLEISRALIDAKLQGQERTVAENLKDSTSAQIIASFRNQLSIAETFDAIRQIEARAAVAYFGTWRNLPVLWPKADLARIPDHWRTVGSRQSPLSGSPRLAVTPVHAILNYCFALLEAETRVAVSALGLDACLGLGLHTDTPNRDSLVFDILEPVRPQIESWLLNWIAREPLRRIDFFETATGNCRLKSNICARLSETSLTWSKLVAPWAEYVARTLWTRTSLSKTNYPLATPLTQQHRREAKGQVEPPSVFAPRPQRTCRGCGAVLGRGQRKHCALCGVDISRTNIMELARRGRIVSKNAESRARLSASQKRQHAARRGWVSSQLPAWLNQESYRVKVLPLLATITVPTISRKLNVSEPYATKVRRGQFIPHPMHWPGLAELVGVSKSSINDRIEKVI
jgi:CRISPR-associated endonuclease Cas1